MLSDNRAGLNVTVPHEGGYSDTTAGQVKEIMQSMLNEGGSSEQDERRRRSETSFLSCVRARRQNLPSTKATGMRRRGIGWEKRTRGGCSEDEPFGLSKRAVYIDRG